MSKQPSVFNRLSKRPQPLKEVFKKKSLTIPGQALTPQEIIRMYVSNREDIMKQRKEIYYDVDISSLMKMSPIERVSTLLELRNRNARHKAEFQSAVKDARTKKQSKKPEKPNDVTTTTNDDDATT